MGDARDDNRERPGRAPAGAGHRERLRERFRRGGLAGFHDYEVIELLLSLGTPRKDCKAPAKAALVRFGSLTAVLEASPRELAEVAGIGPRNVFGLKLIPAAAERFLAARLHQKVPLNNSQALFDYLYHSLRDKTREQFKALFLDARNRVNAIQTLFEGTLTAASVYPREVVRAALDHQAAALILAHNHPSGDPQPSAADRVLTHRLVQACQLMDITLHEHIIIGRDAYYSFADNGLIARFRRESASIAPEAE